jgi:formylglycine-generating enzyme required for sulfatase activity
MIRGVLVDTPALMLAHHLLRGGQVQASALPAERAGPAVRGPEQVQVPGGERERGGLDQPQEREVPHRVPQAEPAPLELGSESATHPVMLPGRRKPAKSAIRRNRHGAEIVSCERVEL